MEDSNQEKQKKYHNHTYTVPYDLNDDENIVVPNQESINKITNKAFLLHSQGNIAEAAKYYQYLIKKNSHNHIVYSNYGVILQNTGKSKEAEIILKKAIQINPDFALGHFNLGNTLKSLGKLREAEKSQRQVIRLDPNYAKAHLNLGLILKDLGQIHQAEASIRASIRIDPNLTEAKLSLESIIKKNIPGWHIPMINDLERNNAYSKAIKQAVKRNENILEIGTGSGLLSMIAIDAGAKTVVTCEMNKSIAEVAEKIICKNGYENQIKVISKKSTDLDLVRDVNKKADVLISEIFSSELVGEGIQHSINDAKKRLLKENGTIIPESGSIKIALLESTPKIHQECFVDSFDKYDLSDFNQITGKKYCIKVKDYGLSYLSEDYIAYSFDFKKDNIIKKDEKIISIPVTKNGICLGIVSWMKINLYQNICFENDPTKNNEMHWSTPIYTFDKPKKVVKNEIITIKASLIEDKVWFELI